ncbi:ribose 5-phosphate isomerase A [Pyrobaculum aerophilum]|uniref:Ribose 5-phosphate isomerase A n=2 Tax=Pyrobaculum aerophilum TaxID=13773 RepID=Q8ZXY8_PYRAE|nr:MULTISPECIES: ribose 5-phosphate isomerase A [Pyrobaculum]AAL63208.1 ribose 5-phosphate isomerase [Pyrobaculum aerophilum str. IM2]MCX8136168.1 ribose 5-phosphate isomerase A [Pyrobaculum aerophilum]HII48033.1 ribose 5-phosphate isomerase A [Pyrobaculum aerophilum]
MLKRLLAREAIRLVKSGMVVGLGSGTTAREFIKALAEAGVDDVLLVATSSDSEILAYEVGLGDRLRPMWAVDRIDLAVDGADEVTKDKVLLKGKGGALLREKIVDYAAEKFVVLIEEHKLVERIPSNNPVPVEVVPWAWRFVAREVEKRFGGVAKLRQDGGKLGPVVTDNGNYIIDWNPPGFIDPYLEDELKAIPGVVENGVFSKRRDATILVASSDGTIKTL